ncbi:MAG: MFS transporter [Oscillospiraceae bacterium]|nr:MFS transporter [Oscillospiraceae bacterium]
MENIYESRDYKRSRNAYTLQCAFEYFVSILMADAFLAKLLKEIGLSDAAVGVISSVVSVAFLVELFSILMMQRMRDMKRTVLICNFLGQALFLLVYLVPFLPIPAAWRGPVAAAGILGGNALRYLVSAVVFRWANGYVDPNKRGTYSAVKEMISLLSGIVFTLGAGFLFDAYEKRGDLTGGFLALAALMLVSGVCNLVCLCLIRREDRTAEEHRPLGEVLRRLFGNRAFRRLTLLTCLWNASTYLSVGFLGTYKTVDLAMTVGTVQIINVAASLCRFAVSRPVGRFSDRTSYARGFRVGLLIQAAAFAVCCFAAPAARWLIAVHMVLYSVSQAGSGQNSTNMTYSYVESDLLVQAMAVKTAAGGIVGFGMSLLGGRILAAVQAAGNTVLGLPVRGQQVLALLSLVLTLGTVLYTALVIERQPAEKR